MTIQEKAKVAIPLLQAVAEGKTIQCKMADGSWVDDNVLISDLANWRIKPEPLEWWINQYSGGSVLHYSPQAAEKEKSRDCIRTIHVREVL